MSTVAGVSLEIDPKVSADPGLHDAIHQAMTFIETRPGVASSSLTAAWRYATTDRSQIEFSLTETDDDISATARRVFPTRHMYDPVSRDVWALRVLGDLFRLRSERIRQRVNSLMAQLHEEEAGGQEDVD